MWPWPKQNSLWCGWAWPWPELSSCCGWAWPWPELNSNDVVDVNDLDLNWTLVKVTFYNTLSGIQVTWMFFVKQWWAVFTKKKFWCGCRVFGELKYVRVPKKASRPGIQGFAFVDFLTKQDAKVCPWIILSEKVIRLQNMFSCIK